MYIEFVSVVSDAAMEHVIIKKCGNTKYVLHPETLAARLSNYLSVKCAPRHNDQRLTIHLNKASSRPCSICYVVTTQNAGIGQENFPSGLNSLFWAQRTLQL